MGNGNFKNPYVNLGIKGATLGFLVALIVWSSLGKYFLITWGSIVSVFLILAYYVGQESNEAEDDENIFTNIFVKWFFFKNREEINKATEEFSKDPKVIQAAKEFTEAHNELQGILARQALELERKQKLKNSQKEI